MKKYSKITEEFLRDIVLPKMSLTEYNFNNIGEIVQFIVSEIEGPLTDKLEDSILTIDEQNMLKLAADIVTEITTREDWDVEDDI